MSKGITVNNLEALFGEEALSEFINVADYVEDDIGNGFFYCQNGYRGFGFLLEPSAFLGLQDFKTLLSTFDLELPVNSAIQILSFPSTNLESIFEYYYNTHKCYDNVKEPENLKKYMDNRTKWLRSSIDNGLINEKFNFYPKNWLTLITIMIPEKSKRNKRIHDTEIISFKNKAFSKLINFGAVEAKPKDIIKILSELLEPYRKTWDSNWDPETKINEQVVSTSTNYKIIENAMFEISDSLNKHKPTYCQVLTTRKFPTYLNLGITQNLFLENYEDKSDEPYMKNKFFTCVNIVIEDKEKEKNALQAKSKNNQWQIKLMGEGKKFFPKLGEIDRESEYLDYLITNHNETIFRMQFSICIYSSDKNKLEEQVSSIESNFSKKNWILQVESDMAIPVFLYSLPFQFDIRYKDISRKFKTSLRSNNAAATPLLNDMKGSFGRVPLSVCFGRTGQIQFFDNFGTDGNANMVVAAGSRAGKTFWILDFVAQSLAAGRYVRIIEAGRNFEPIAQEFGGKFLRFKDEDNICLNFFTDAKTLSEGTELHPEEVTTIIPLIGLMIGRQLISSNDEDYDAKSKSDNAIISSYVEKAVKNAYRNERRQCGLYHVKKELEAIFKQIQENDKFTDERLRDVIIALSPYADETGNFYKYFNGPRNVYFSDNALVIFELNDLKNKDENLMFVVLMALIKNVANEFYGEELEDVLKNLICDEAWMILDHPFVASFLIRIWRTIGKHKGAGISISQDVDLYFKNKDMEAIYNNSTYKVFLKQNKEQLDKLADEKKISSDEFFINKLKSLRSYAGLYSEMLVKMDSGFFISRIIVDRFSFYLYSTADKVPDLFEVMKKLNIKKNEASYMFAFIDNNPGSTIEEAYEELLIYQGKKKRVVEEFNVVDKSLNTEVAIDNKEINDLNSNITIFEKIKQFFKI